MKTIILTILLYLFFHSSMLSQSFLIGGAISSKLENKYLNTSLIGLNITFDYFVIDFVSLKTSFGFNYQEFKNTSSIKKHESMFFFSLEESIIYRAPKVFIKPYFGVGFGFYFSGMSINDMGVVVDDHGFIVGEDISFDLGYNFLVGFFLPGDVLFLEFKYIILPAILQQEMYLEIPEFHSVKTTDTISMNSFFLSIGLMFN